MTEVTIFGITLPLKPVAFTIFGWDVYWYGILIAIGFSLALVYGYRNAKRYDINLDKLLDVVLVTVPVAILCARTYYVLFDGVKLKSFADFFGLGESSGVSGLAIYGGVIGAVVAGGIMCKIKKINILSCFDLAAPAFLIGQGIGRWGNFVNQEAFGTFTGSSWWGMESEKTISYMRDFMVDKAYSEGASYDELLEITGEGMVHPCFLYESIWCLLGFLVLHHFSKKRRFKGEIGLLYCVWYGFGRGFIELLRTDSLMIGPFKVSSLLSFAICIGAIIAILVIRNKMGKKQEAYESVFSENFEESAEDTAEDDNTLEENEND